MKRAIHTILRAAVAGWLVVASTGAAAQALEHEVKAAFLFRFLSFVEWPQQALPAAEAPLVIGVVGADDVLAELEAIVPGRRVQGRPVTVQRWREGGSLDGIHALFVGRNATGVLARLREPRAVLVVSDDSNGLARGSVINFVPAEGRVGFEVALDEAERRGLRISSRMLAVARNVRRL